MSENNVKRFYAAVSVLEDEGLFCVALDGRKARTVGRNTFGCRSAGLATALAAEWEAQGEYIALSEMPLSRLQGFVLDGGDKGCAEWREVIAQYAQSDLLCYRAPERELAARQAASWQPVLDTVGARLGAIFSVTEGVMAVDQSPDLVRGLEKTMKQMTAEETLSAKLLTEILGSAALALAIFWGEFSADDAFALSRLDETHQNESWGIDEEAGQREERVKAELDLIVRFLALSREA